MFLRFLVCNEVLLVICRGTSLTAYTSLELCGVFTSMFIKVECFQRHHYLYFVVLSFFLLQITHSIIFAAHSNQF